MAVKLDTEYNSNLYLKELLKAELLGFKGKNATNLAINNTSLNLQYDAGRLPEVTVTPGVKRKHIKDSGIKNIHYSKHIQPVTESNESKIAAGMIGIPMLSTSPVTGALVEGFGTAGKSILKGIDLFKTAHPYLSTTIDAGLSVDGIHNLTTDQGINKTKSLFKSRLYLKGTKSAIGDLLDIGGIADLLRVTSKIVNPAYRRAWAYHKIPLYKYEGALKRGNEYLKGLLSGVTPNTGVSTEANWIRDFRKELLNDSDGFRYGYLNELYKVNKDAAIELAIRGREEASRLYNKLPSKYNYYIPNGDGTYRYNLDKILNDWQKLSGTKEFYLPYQGFYTKGITSNGIDPITGAGAGLTKNEFIGRSRIGTDWQGEEFGIKLIEDILDVHPFSRKNRQFSDLLQNHINIKMDKFRKKVGNLYTTLFDLTNSKKSWGATPLNRFWYKYLGGQQLNQLRNIKNPRLPGYVKIKNNDPNNYINEWRPNRFWQNINEIMSKLEVGQITGAKPFLMRTEVPYTLKNSLLTTKSGFPLSLDEILGQTIVLGHHSDKYNIPPINRLWNTPIETDVGKLNYLNFFK